MSVVDGAQRGIPVPSAEGVDLTEAEEFFRLHAAEQVKAPDPRARLAQARAEVADRGTYTQTPDEVAFGARVAWRNANRCVGRLYWNSLVVRDRRDVVDADDIASECVEHLRVATNDGRIRPVITVFAPVDPAAPPSVRLYNDQLIRYAGYDDDQGRIGDPARVDLTRRAVDLGWTGKRSAFDVLPLVMHTPDGGRVYEIPDDAVLEVSIVHPELEWFADLRLTWYAVPAISSMPLRIGGITYPLAPFNGWYMGTEIGSRNLADADRYDVLPEIGRRMGLDMSGSRTMWKDRVLVEVNRAVVWSFDRAGARIADHHTESERFMSFVAAEERSGRVPTAEWSWVVPPMSAAATPVYHRYYDEQTRLPGFLRPPAHGCPVQH